MDTATGPATTPRRLARVLAAACAGALLLSGAAAVSAPPAAATPAIAIATKAAPKLKATAKSAQVKTNRVRTTVTLVAPLARTTKTKTATIKLAGVTKKVPLRWSKGAYRAKASLTTTKVGTLTAKLRGLRTIKTAVAAPRTTVRWSTTTMTLDAGASATRTVSVTPAWGRTLLVQRKSGTSWTTVSKVKTPKRAQATVRVRLAAGTPGTKTTWRVVASKSAAAARASAAVTVTTRAKPNTPTPAPTSPPKTTPTPTPAPTPTPTKPPALVWPQVVDGVTFTGPCGTETVVDENSEEYWVQRDLDCTKQDSIRTVLDTWTVNPLCGVSQSCADRRDTISGAVRGKSWTTSRVATWANPTTLIAPNWLAELNAARAAEGAAPVQAMPLDLLSSAAPMRSAGSSALVRENGHIAAHTFTATGQGGFPQYWVDRLVRDHLDVVKEWETPHSCPGVPGSILPELGLNQYGTCVKRDETNDPSNYYNAYLPADQRDYVWGCGELVGGRLRPTSSSELIDAFRGSPNHWNGLMNPRATYASVGAAVGDDGSAIVVITTCQLSPRNPGPGETAPVLDARPDYLPVVS